MLLHCVMCPSRTSVCVRASLHQLDLTGSQARSFANAPLHDPSIDTETFRRYLDCK